MGSEYAAFIRSVKKQLPGDLTDRKCAELLRCVS
jgi:hypothetical protein